MDEIAAEVEGALDGLAPADWDRGPDGGWSVRRTLDHVSGGFEIGIRPLEPWPLDPDKAQVAALAELIARLRSAPAEPVEQSGMNREGGRDRWTARKVVRAARAAQAATRAHVEAGGPPAATAARHADARMTTSRRAKRSSAASPTATPSCALSPPATAARAAS